MVNKESIQNCIEILESEYKREMNTINGDSFRKLNKIVYIIGLLKEVEE